MYHHSLSASLSEQKQNAQNRRIQEDSEIREVMREMEERLTYEMNEPLSDRLARERELDKILEKPPSSRFSQVHLLKACQILKALRKPGRRLRRPSFENDVERVMTYELTICVIKYSVILNDTLDVAQYFIKFPVTNLSEKDEVLVVAYDLMERGYRVDPDKRKWDPPFNSIQDNIMSLKIRIMAHLARMRIKNEAIQIEGLLPEKLRHQRHLDQNPIYAWINLTKSTVSDVVYALTKLGFSRAYVEDDILMQPESFYLDETHGNLLRFHSSRLDYFRTHELVLKCFLILQDKSDCLPVYSLAKALFYKELLIRNRDKMIIDNIPPETLSSNGCLDHWYDGVLDETCNKFTPADTVVVTHCGSGFAVAHLAVQLSCSVPQWLSRTTEAIGKMDLATSIANKFLRRPTLMVAAFGVPAEKIEEITYFLKRKIGVTNIKLYKEAFIDIQSNDPRVRNALGILVNPPSSGSALKDPVKYLTSEGGDEEVMIQLAKYVANQTKAYETDSEVPYYKSDQSQFLAHALSIPKVKLIMYTTCSILASENKDVVDAAIRTAELEMEFQRRATMTEALTRKKVQTYTEITYTKVAMNKILDKYPAKSFNGPFFEQMPNSAASGGFIALVRRTERRMNVQRSTPSTPDLSAVPSILATSSKSCVTRLVSQRLTQKQIVDYLQSKKINDPHGALISLVSVTSAGSPRKKKTEGRKAILNRISVPTHSSLAKKKEKYPVPLPVSAGGVPRPPSRQTMPNGPTYAQDSAGPVCVCARHANKFPELLMNGSERNKSMILSKSVDRSKSMHCSRCLDHRCMLHDHSRGVSRNKSMDSSRSLGHPRSLDLDRSGGVDLHRNMNRNKSTAARNQNTKSKFGKKLL